MRGDPAVAPAWVGRCRALLLDLDGTLVDSNQAILRAWRAWAARSGIDPARLDEVVYGRGAVEAIAELLPGLSDGQLREHSRAVLRLQELDRSPGLPVLGAPELVCSIGSRPWAVVTGCTRAMASARLAAGKLRVPPVLVTEEDVTAGKPDPEGYRLALRRLGISAEQAIAVEDAPAGIRAGKAIGLRTIAVAATHPAEELAAADLVVARLSDISVVALGEEMLCTVHKEGLP